MSPLPTSNSLPYNYDTPAYAAAPPRLPPAAPCPPVLHDIGTIEKALTPSVDAAFMELV